MKPRSFRFLICLTPFFLLSCVAEENFDNSAFEAVEPESTAEEQTSEESAPDIDAYQVKFETTKGDFVIEVNPSWAPRGAAQFKAAVADGVYDEARFFRVLDGFMAQFGIAGDPAKMAKWREKVIQDDPVVKSNTRGMVSYAMAGPDTRTTQVFINYGNNSGSLDPQGFAPFGQVVEGMDVVDSLYSGYGEGAPQGNGPAQGRIQSEGNAYLAKEFPKLDYIKSATIIELEQDHSAEENSEDESAEAETTSNSEE